MFCHKCGTPLADTEFFCHKCGTKVGAKNGAPQNANTSAKTNKANASTDKTKKKKSKLPFILGAVVLVIFMIIIATQNGDPHDATDSGEIQEVNLTETLKH